MSGMKELGRRVAEHQDRLAPGDEIIAEARQRFLSSGSEARGLSMRQQVTVGLAAAGALAAAAALILLLSGGDVTARIGEGGRELSPGEWINSPGDREMPLLFSDGSIVKLLPESGARVVELDEAGAKILLERGTAKVHVIHTDDTRWLVDVGPYEVVVTGTMFNVSWDPGGQVFSLELEDGSVTVTGPMVADGRRIESGEVITAWVSQDRMEVSRNAAAREIAVAHGGVAPIAIDQGTEDPSRPRDEPAQEPGLAGDEPGSRLAALSGGDSAADRGTPSVGLAREAGEEEDNAAVADWNSLARAGKYVEATRAAQDAGLDAILLGAPTADLLALGDAARLSRSYAIADLIYSAVRDRSPGTGQSASAALALGRMAFDQQHMYSKAARWLSTYIEESPDGKLVREALGRLVEARDRAGDLQGARQAADRYLAEYPAGPHAPYARKLLEPADDHR